VLIVAMRTPVVLWFLVPLVLIAGLGVFWADAVWWHKDSGVQVLVGKKRYSQAGHRP
jgi:hypothetical protein